MELEQSETAQRKGNYIQRRGVKTENTNNLEELKHSLDKLGENPMKRRKTHIERRREV